MVGSSLTSSSTASDGQRLGFTRRPRSTSSGDRHSTGFGAPKPSPSEPATTTASTSPASSQLSAMPVATPVHCDPSTRPSASTISSWTPKCASSSDASS